MCVCRLELVYVFFFFQAEDGIRDTSVTGVQTCALPISLGSGYKIEPPLRRGRQTESLIGAYSRLLFISSLLALLIGIFLIFNAFSVSVSQRRVQIGILRALGQTRVQIQGMFLGESLVLGAIGSIVGVVV